MTGARSKVQCCKEQYCIGTWNVRSMNQGKLEVVKQEMARVNVDILGISELKWTGMGEFNSDDHYIYYCGQESLRRNGVAIIVNKRVRNAILGCNLKNDRMIPVRFQGKPFNIMVIQAYAPTSIAEAFMVNRRVRNAVLGCNLKNDRMISVLFQSKPFNIMVIEVYAPTTKAEKLKLNGSVKTYKTF